MFRGSLWGEKILEDSALRGCGMWDKLGSDGRLGFEEIKV